MVSFASSSSQSQWCHTTASLHKRTPFTYRVPEGHWRSVVALNLLYGAGPLALALRCVLRPAFFLKTVPQEQANQQKKKND